VALLRGDVRQALYFHPLFWMVPVGAVLVAAAQVKPSLKPLVLNKGVGLGALSVFLGVWLARLAGLFPGVATRRW
jgi:hypothetical protein